MSYPPRGHAAAGHDGTTALLERYARTREPALRRELAERYLPLARFAASHYAAGSEPFDDLQQVASIGLLNAIDRFDPENGSAFSSFALPTMHGELRRYFRDRSWAVRPPRTLQEHALLVARTTDDLEGRRRRAPTIEEVASAAQLSITAALEAREALAARQATSLTAIVALDDGDVDGDRRHGVIDDGFARAEARATVAALSAGALTRREREIMRLRFEEDLTQSEIGTVVGLSQMHVSRVLRGAIVKLRAVASTTAVAS